MLPGLVDFFLTNHPDNYCKISSSWDGFDVRARLATVEAPTRILHPSFDDELGFKTEYLAADEAMYPNAKLIQVEGESHWLPYESPAKYTAMLVDFYSKI